MHNYTKRRVLRQGLGFCGSSIKRLFTVAHKQPFERTSSLRLTTRWTLSWVRRWATNHVGKNEWDFEGKLRIVSFHSGVRVLEIVLVTTCPPHRSKRPRCAATNTRVAVKLETSHREYTGRHIVLVSLKLFDNNSPAREVPGQGFTVWWQSFTDVGRTSCNSTRCIWGGAITLFLLVGRNEAIHGRRFRS